MHLGCALLWLWHRPTATDPIQPLAWELPYAPYGALKKKKSRGTTLHYKSKRKPLKKNERKTETVYQVINSKKVLLEIPN